MDIIKSIEHEQLKSKIPDIKIGDTVRVHQRVKEGNRERIQVFEGIVIKKQNGGLNETFTVRRISYGVGVEKTFLIHSPLVEKVELVRVGKVRRAKLYYLRDRIGKAAKTKENVGANLKREQIIVKEEAEKAREIEEEKKAEKAAEAKAEETKPVETTEAKTVEKAEAKTEETKTAEKAESKATDTKTTEPKAE
jgi:large subunit ribosomal protein L19